MARRFFLIICCIVLLTPFTLPTHADETTTIYAESGRFSLERPAGWITEVLPHPRENTGSFVGDTLLLADSDITLESWASGSTTGEILFARLESLVGEESEMEPADWLRTYIDAYGVTGSTPEFLEINGCPAARYSVNDRYSAYFFPGAEKVGQTVVIVDHFAYNILYTGPDLEPLETIAESLIIYPEPAVTERPPLSINDVVAVPIRPGWLVETWSGFNPLSGFASIGSFEATFPEYYLILFEEDWTFLDMIYKSLRRGSSVSTTALPGSCMVVGIYPYDSLFGSGTAAVDDAQRLFIFKRIAESMQFSFDEVTPQQLNGVPALTAESTKLLGWDTNRGTLLVVDAAPNFYAILIAGPQGHWDESAETLVFEQLSVTPPTTTDEGAQLGQRAPDFTATLLDGSTVSLSDYRGKPVVLSFWATWCEPCREEMPQLQEAYEERDDLVFLAIDFMEDQGTVAAFAEENDLTLPIVLDLSGEINFLYHIQGYPTSVVIDREGIISAITFEMPELYKIK
jgi:thiol-disulfide isomerase/thioredoxin